MARNVKTDTNSTEGLLDTTHEAYSLRREFNGTAEVQRNGGNAHRCAESREA
jgi:hypothetical protein